MRLQYTLKYETVRTSMPKKKIFAYLFTFSLSSQHISFSLSGSLIALSIPLSQPHQSHNTAPISPCHTMPPSFVPSPRYATSPSFVPSPHHATLPSLPCHPPHHRNLPPSDLSQSAYCGGFCFWVYLIWWMWVCASGSCRCCCGSGCWWLLLL